MNAVREDRTLIGRVVDISGHAYVANIEVGLAAIRPHGEKLSVIVKTDEDGNFLIVLPDGPIDAARVATELDGAQPIELDIEDGEIVPGEVVFSVAFEQGTHLRFGGA